MDIGMLVVPLDQTFHPLHKLYLPGNTLLSITREIFFCFMKQSTTFSTIWCALSIQINGMLRHSLATLEGEQEFIVFYRAILSQEGSPLSLAVGSCSLFVPSPVCLHSLQSLGPASVDTLLKGRKENNSLQLKREGSVQGIGRGGKKLLQVLLEN